MAREGWVESRLGALLVESDERAGSAEALPVLSVTKNRGILLASERFATPQHGRNLARYRVAHRDQLVIDPMLLWDGALGLQRRVPAGLVSPDYRVYSTQPDIEPAFVEYLLKSRAVSRYFKSGARGTNVRRNRIARSDFESIRVAVPPLSEQRKIAAILSSVDDTIERTQAVIDQLEVLKARLLDELLTTGVAGTHNRLVKTMIGKMPDSWEAASLGSVLDRIDTGWSPMCDSKPAGPGEWGVLKVSSVSWGVFKPDENKRLPEGVEPRPEVEVHDGDLLVSRANTKELVGRSVLVRNPPSRLMASDKILRLRPSNRARAEFLNYVLGAKVVREQIEEAATGSSGSMKNISQQKLRGVVIPLPPTDEQDSIVSALDVVNCRLQSEMAALEAQRLVKRGLLDALLTGRIRVNVTDQEAA